MSSDLSFLKNLTLDRYYKIMILIGIIILTYGCISSESWIYLGLFFACFGIGEWLTTYEEYIPRNVYTNPHQNIIGFIRNWNIQGIFFYVFSIGSLLKFMGLY